MQMAVYSRCMKTKTRQIVKCSECGEVIYRVIWNYGKNRPILNFFCNTSCKGIWQRKQRESLGFTKEWLEDQYITQGKDANIIALEIGRDGKRVWEWLKDYGIPTRPRGGKTSPNCFKKGQENLFKGKKHSPEVKEKIRELRKKDGHVPYLKNGVHWLSLAKKEDHPNWKGGISPERQACYSSKEWSMAVKEVWKRDNAICQKCGKDHRIKKYRGTFHVHHLASFAIKDLRTEPMNLILLCAPCHRWVHGKKNTEKLFLQEDL